MIVEGPYCIICMIDGGSRREKVGLMLPAPVSHSLEKSEKNDVVIFDHFA